MNIAIVISTPYQIFVALEMLFYEEEFKGAKVDLFLGDKFNGGETFAKRIEGLNIVQNIYRFRDCKPGWTDMLLKFSSALAPRKHIILAMDKKIKLPKYDIVFSSFPLYFSLALESINQKNCNIYYFDDGTGSYYGDIQLDFFPKYMKLFFNLTRTNLEKLRPKRLYVNNRSVCETDLCADVRQICRVTDPEFDRWLEQIFGEKQYDYKKLDFIFMAQPNDELIDGVEIYDKKVCEILSEKCENVAIRLHPRMDNNIEMGIKKTDNRLWELVSYDEIDDHHVIISDFSSSQFTPKLLYNKEPYLIFLYNIYPTNKKESAKKMISWWIAQIKKAYSSSDKIFEPGSFEEFEMILEKLSGHILK